MEFDELKKIWNMENQTNSYAINEVVLHNRIMVKKAKTQHIANFSEWLAIGVNAGAGLLMLYVNLKKTPLNIYMSVLSGWLLLSAIYVVLYRAGRMRKENRFDESMLGDLRKALSTARYQVRLSRFLRWNGLVVAMLTALELWEAGKPPVITLGIMVVFILANWAAGWEHRFYEKRRRELEVLLAELEQE